MKAIVFAAGLGTRLRPLTDDRPKALVSVGGVPMLERVIAKLINAGIKEIVVNVHHFPDMIIDFLKSRNYFGIDINVSDERDCLLDTGGGILKARNWLDCSEPILVHNADILTDFSIPEMLQRHEASGAIATLLVKERQTKRYLLLDHDHRMKGWTNIATGEVLPPCINDDMNRLSKYAFGGVHIISPDIFIHLENYNKEIGGTTKDIKPFSIMPFYIQACQRCEIRGFKPSMPYKWHDIGKIESLRLAEQDFSN